MRRLMHWSLAFLVYVLRMDSFRPALDDYYGAEGMSDETGAAHMDAVGRKIFLITAVMCVAVMNLGYSFSKLFTESVIGKSGWWLMFFCEGDWYLHI